MDKGIFFFFVIPCLLAAIIVWYMTPFGAAISPDSIAYLDIATHFRQGNGLSSTDFSLAHYGENITFYNPTWPPLYPVLLALSADVPTSESAVFISWVAFSLTLFQVQCLLQPVLGSFRALISTLPLAFSVPLLTIHAYVWSEQWFVVFSLGILLSLQRYFICGSGDHPDHVGQMYAMIGVTVFSILAFYTRYAGIAYLPVLAIACFFSSLSSRLYATLAANYLVHIAAILFLLLYNYNVTGNLSGATRLPANEPIITHLENAVSTFIAFFWSSERSAVAQFCALAGAFLLVALGVRFSPHFQLKSGDINRANTVKKITLLMCLVLIFLYNTTIISMRSMVKFDDIDIRLLSVNAPFLWVAGILMFAWISKTRLHPGFSFFLLFLLASMAFNGYFSLLDVRKNLATQGVHGFKMGIKGYSYNDYNPGPGYNGTREFHDTFMNKDSILVTDKPAIFRRLTGLTCVQKSTELTKEELIKLSRLPEKSMMMLGQEEAVKVANRLNALNIHYQFMQAGAQLYLMLPLMLPPDSRD